MPEFGAPHASLLPACRRTSTSWAQKYKQQVVYIALVKCRVSFSVGIPVTELRAWCCGHSTGLCTRSWRVQAVQTCTLFESFPCRTLSRGPIVRHYPFCTSPAFVPHPTTVCAVVPTSATARALPPTVHRTPFM